MKSLIYDKKQKQRGKNRHREEEQKGEKMKENIYGKIITKDKFVGHVSITCDIISVEIH